MSNQAYTFNLLQESFNVELGTEPGLTENYSILFSRIKPLDNQQLKYNAITGFMDWITPLPGNLPGSYQIYVNVNPPASPTDGMLWKEIGSETDLWEWDTSNATWWSNVKTCDLQMPVHNDPNGAPAANSAVGRCINYTNSPIRKIRFINTRWMYMVSLGHSASIWYTYNMRYINSVGAFIAMQNFTTQTWTNTTAVLRQTNDMTFLNTVGTGLIRFADNIFSFELSFSSGNDLGRARPFGTTTVVYRHNRA